MNTTVESVDGEIFTLEKGRNLAKRYFYFGFCFLPFLWFTNVWLFWHEFRGGPNADVEIKKYTRWSAIGFVVTSLIFLPWFLLYIIDGDNILSQNVYEAIDVTGLNIEKYVGI